MNGLFYNNRYLFSEIFLKEITNLEERPEVTSSLNSLKDYLEYAGTDSLSNWKSSFIQKVLGVLAFGYKSIDDRRLFLYKQGESENPISVCFVILPEENIDNTTIGKNWAEKIIRDLKNNNLKWGILTDGNKWRIYHTEETAPYENYLEIDLEKILAENDASSYMIFYEFMKVNNFIATEEGKLRFDELKEESYKKIEYIEDELKRALKQREGENGKGVLADISMGYVEYLRLQGITDFTDEDLRKTIYSGAMLYMFRLLFLFYASARNLLNDEETGIFSAIIDRAKEMFKSKTAKKESFQLWYDLSDIFGKIDIHYNGGLFDPLENKFITDNKISDRYLCGVLYNMNYYEDKNGGEHPISYRDMGVRHLGTLYEGLLEHKLFVAEENIQVKSGKKGLQFIPESEGGKIIEGQYIPKGQVYFGTDKGERKATGSYYTPEYIVDYIVTNTVGEKLKELKEEFEKENRELFNNIKAAVDENEKASFNSYLEEQILNFVKNKILKLSVLDPAMGSGHFLVNAANKIANFITEFLNDYELISNINSSTVYWRRRVVENSLYGVDLNPLAVELAKLSLWILSMAKDAHLSFLNHHLKCGNSLIGARLSDIGIYPGYKKGGKNNGEFDLFEQDENFQETVNKVISDYLAIEERETNTKEDIDFKKELLNEIDQALLPYKKVCDFHTSIYFNNNVSETEYFEKIKNPDLITTEKNNYFNWELEFPEVFRKFGGFDCVVGNPPYINIYDINKRDRLFFDKYFATSFQKYDIYILFYESGIKLLNNNGLISFITSDKFLSQGYGLKLRKIILSLKIIKIINFTYNVFNTANVYTNILILSKNINKSNIILIKQVNNSEGLLTNNYKKLSQDIFNNLESKNFRINLTNEKLEIINKILEKSVKLNQICSVNYGLRPSSEKLKVGKNAFIYKENKSGEFKKYFEGKDMGYWSIKNSYFIDYNSDLMYNSMFPELFENEKLVAIRTLSDIYKLRFIYDNEGYYCNDSTVILNLWYNFENVDYKTIKREINKKLINYSKKFLIKYLQGILNSTLIKFYVNEMLYDGTHFYPNHIKQLPIIEVERKYQEEVSNITDELRILEKGKGNDNYNIKQKELDEMIYSFYELSNSDIDIIKKSFNNE